MIITINKNNNNIDNKKRKINSIVTDLPSLPKSPFFNQQQTQQHLRDPNSTDPLSTTRTTNSNSTDPLSTTRTTNLFKKMTGTGEKNNAAPTSVAVSDSFDPELAASDISVPPVNDKAFH